MGRVSPYLSGTQDSSTFLLYHLWNCLSFSRSPHEPHGAQWLPGTNFQTIYIYLMQEAKGKGESCFSNGPFAV